MRGVELVDVEIDGELQNVVINGIDIAPLVDAELNRRMPERAKMRPDDADGFRAAWAILERLWEGTVAWACTFPVAELHRGVDDEWSFVQTLRHLSFATAAWVNRMILGTASPWASARSAVGRGARVGRHSVGPRRTAFAGGGPRDPA